MTKTPDRIIPIAEVTDPSKVRVMLDRPDYLNSVPMNRMGLAILSGDNTWTGDNIFVGEPAVVGVLNLLDALLVTNGQIQFPATANPSSNANTLDDYEEGTFTPTIVGSTTAGVGTYSLQFGRYTKIGRLVFIEISFTWSAHTGTGNIEVHGLPFTVGTSHTGPITISGSNLTFPNQLSAQIQVGTATLIPISISTGAGAVAVAMDTSATMRISGTYVV